MQAIVPPQPATMGVTRGLLTGFTLAGIVTFAYEQNLYSSSAYLRNALVSLSKDLDSLRIQSRVDEVPKEPVSLEKLRLGDQMKMQVGASLASRGSVHVHVGTSPHTL